MTSPTRRRVGIVGLSHYHVTGWVETLEAFADRLEIVALHDPDPDRAASLAPPHHDPALRPSLGERYRALPFETSLERLIAAHDLDIALVTMPDAEAPAAIERLARAGIHLLIDKPAARSAEEARRAFAAVEAAGVRAVVGLTRRYAPAVQAARSLVADGSAGTLVSAEAVFATSSVAVRGPDNLLFDPARSGGGILRWLGVHDLDTLLWLTGEPIVEVGAMAGRVHPGVAVEDVISVALRFASGAVGTVHHTYALPARGYRTWLAVRGLRASLELRGDDELTVLTAGGPDGGLAEDRRRFEVPPAPGYGAAGRSAVIDLLGAIDEGRPTAADGAALVAALEVIDAAYLAARSGRVVRLD